MCVCVCARAHMWECVDPNEIGLSKIFLPQDGWTALKGTCSPKLPVLAYIPWFVPNTCGFSVTCGGIFIAGLEIFIDYEYGIV